MSYQKYLTGAVQHIETGAFIPDDPRNLQRQEYEEWLSAGNTPQPAESLADVLKVKLAEINQAYESAASAMVAEYPSAERLTWEIQRKEAIAWEADNSAPTPFLDAVARERGIDRVEHITRTLRKTEAFLSQSAKITGIRHALQDRAERCETVQELEKIRIDYA